MSFVDAMMHVPVVRCKHHSHQVCLCIKQKKIGNVRRVTTAFSFKAPSQEWRDGGNGRTNKEREPFGCFGDQV